MKTQRQAEKALPISAARRFIRNYSVKSLAILVLVVAGSACSWLTGETDLERARKEAEAGQYDSALFRLEKLVKSHPEAKESLEGARLGAKITFLEQKNYALALFYYKHLVLYSTDEKERVESQKRVAEIYFERLSDHGQSILELNKLLQIKHAPEEEQKFRMNLAKANFYQSRFQQAESEVDLVLAKALTKDVEFEGLLLKGNIYFSTKQQDRAIEVFKKLMLNFPERAKEEHVGMTLAICYEEKNDYASAKQVLNEIKVNYPNPKFLEAKIQRLEEQERQRPGARGLKK
jgi:tetratricopeptide (TPR) repeat protein